MRTTVSDFNSSTDYKQSSHIYNSCDKRVSQSLEKSPTQAIGSNFRFDQSRLSFNSAQSSSPNYGRGMQLTISGNAFTRKASQLYPETKLVYGWKADQAVRETMKLPKTFYNHDKPTLRELDKQKGEYWNLQTGEHTKQLDRKMKVGYFNHENIKYMRQRVYYSIHKKQYSQHLKRLAQVHKQEGLLETNYELDDCEPQQPRKQMQVFQVSQKKQSSQQYSYEFSLGSGAKVYKIKTKPSRDPLLAIQSKQHLRNRNYMRPDKSNSDILLDENVGETGFRDKTNINTIERPREWDHNNSRTSDSPVINRHGSSKSFFKRQSGKIVGIYDKSPKQNNYSTGSLRRVSQSFTVDSITRTSNSKSPIKEYHIARLRKKQLKFSRAHQSVDKQIYPPSTRFNIPQKGYLRQSLNYNSFLSRKPVSRFPELDQYMAHLTVLKLQQLKSTSDNNLTSIHCKLQDARQKNALERRKVIRDMSSGGRFAKSSMTGEYFPTVPTMSIGASTYHSVKSIAPQQQDVSIESQPGFPKKYLMQHKLEEKRKYFVPTVSTMNQYAESREAENFNASKFYKSDRPYNSFGLNDFETVPL